MLLIIPSLHGTKRYQGPAPAPSVTQGQAPVYTNKPRPHSSAQARGPPPQALTRTASFAQARAPQSGQASQLKRKLSRKLDISFDQLDTTAFPFPFLNTIVSLDVCPYPTLACKMSQSLSTLDWVIVVS